MATGRPRGRPRKVIEEPTKGEKTIQQVIADVLHDSCMVPGCTLRNHLWDASDIMDALHDAGFEVVKRG